MQVLDLARVNPDSTPSLAAAAVPGATAAPASAGFLLGFPLRTRPPVLSGEAIPDESAGWLLGLELFQPLLVVEVVAAHGCELVLELM